MSEVLNETNLNQEVATTEADMAETAATESAKAETAATESAKGTKEGFTLWWAGLIVGILLGMIDGKPFFNNLWIGIVLTGALFAVVGWGIRIQPKKKNAEEA